MGTLIKSHTLCFALIFAVTTLMAQEVSTPRAVVSFDTNWFFKKDTMLSGPEKQDFDVSSWRKVNVPHDWSIEDLPIQIQDSIIGPFSKGSPGKTRTGFSFGGTAWYRNSFKVDKKDVEKSVYIYFGGVYMNCDVWINGHHLGNHPNGYTSFYYNLTPYLQPTGQDNVIAVRVRNEGSNSRWYSGSGIYRHVNLIYANPVHIDIWGVNVTTPKVSETSSDVEIVTTINNTESKDNSVVLFTEVKDARGKVIGTSKIAKSLIASNKTEIKQNIAIENAILWSPDLPYLYKAKVTILQKEKELDIVSTTFGIREIKVDTQNGLQLNSKRVLLKGGCIHHDNGPLGSVAIDRAEERKIELLKANGFNAIRSSHNPPSEHLLDVCDRLGMLVIDEAFDMWTQPKTTDDYSSSFNDWWDRDLTSMILRDRNHPAIIFWSIGNEIPNRVKKTGLDTRVLLKSKVKELDTTRPVTEAICVTPKWEEKTPAAFKELDVAGYNYQDEKYESDHEIFPDRVIYASESYPAKALESWNYVEKYPYVIGDFVWTAFDYIGEAAIGSSAIIPDEVNRINQGWPWFNAFCGDLDLIGNKKPQSYYRDVVWRRSKLEMMVSRPTPESMKEFVTPWGWPDMRKSWSWPGEEGKPMKVTVYSHCQVVKLELNGKIVGEQSIPENSITATFNILYEAGTLLAKGFENGKEVGTTVLKTVGSPVAIKLVTDRPQIKVNRNDLSYINVEVVDHSGNLVPYADDIEISYSVTGNVELVGVGNGNPQDVSSFQQPRKKVFQGRGLAILRPTGKRGIAMIMAKAEGLKPDSIKIRME